MLSYQEIKTWFAENKQKMVLAACFILVFIIGFGTGRYNKESALESKKLQNQNNYTTKPAVGTTGQGAGEGTAGAAAPDAAKEPAKVLETSVGQSCPVKGNPSSKIYHVPGGAFYSTLKSPKCFITEADAQAAGYRKSGR